MKDIIIAIDGFSSTGKSTIAKKLANKLEYVYIDTGAMYRGITLFAMDKGLIVDSEIDKVALLEKLPEIFIYFKHNSSTGVAHIYLNDVDVSKKIRSLEVSNYVSLIAAIPEVRKKLVEQQQVFGKEKALVMDGRDIGTVVFPNAELKIFMTASANVRAVRRYKELIEGGDSVSYEEVLENIEKRDLIDTTRADSPLIKAEDAVVIDNSELTIEEQLDYILELVKNKIEEK
ncbi:cytidylate kinase [Mesonia hippocampi]|uniref:Cytidylate kinase n=1 Tax=Mesonia hippocampi TaxID=1628250 RepID=A0A840ENW7_9FLAO|nr:(d)CMP kinase [Mesonia hippocampi]MBB4120069.1 cytidylate kinase [Mesonia hippocampi]